MYEILKCLACIFFCVTIKMRPILYYNDRSIHDEISKNNINTHRDISVNLLNGTKEM